MGRTGQEEPLVGRQQLESFLQQHLGCRRLIDAAPLGESEAGELKDYGYGKPLDVHFESADGRHRRVVLRTMSPDPFGHDRRADRVAEMVANHDVFPTIDKHVQPLAMGVFADDGAMVAMPRGEPFLLTDFAEGTLYATDLQRIRKTGTLSDLDVERAAALADYLVELHAERVPTGRYQRAIRDLVGSGEGIFGLCDSYGGGDGITPPSRLEALELAAVRWRHRLAGRSARARRTHGDFHPFNLLFRESTDLSVLDCSRGGCGDPADDVTCLAVNYLFFSLISSTGGFSGPFRRLWDVFWERYLHGSGDDELLSVVAPFFSWRCLVLASPLWYPNVSASTRDTLLRFAERLLEGASFTPRAIDGLLR